MKRYAVIGLGQFGYSLAKTLIEKGQDVLVIDRNQERVQEVISELPNAVAADATDEKAMLRIGINECDCAIISSGTNLEANILAAILAGYIMQADRTWQYFRKAYSRKSVSSWISFWQS